MFFKLLLLFTVIPIIELSLLIKVGSIIGTFNTVAIVILTAIIGAYMVRIEGIGVMYRIQTNLNQGVFPAEEMINGMMILVAGALLLTPGFFTDAVGFLMVFPATRNVLKKMVRHYFQNRISTIHIDRYP